MSKAILTFYLVRNRDGEFFRAKGYHGSGATWVKDATKARVYQKLSPARSLVTFFTQKWPEYGIPEIVVLTVTEISVLNETERVEKSIRNKELKEHQKKVARQKRELQSAEVAFKAAKDRYEKAKKGV